MPWYEDWFDRDEYELVYQERDDEDARRCVDLIEQVADLRPGADILDMGCGRGRHALELGRRGYKVRGIDLSAPSIEAARKLATEEDLNRVTFDVGDMRENTFDECFDGVVNLFTAFGYFEDDEDHQKVIDTFAGALRPGGSLVQDFLNAPYLCNRLVPGDAREEDGVHIEQRRWVEDGRINKEILLQKNGDAQTFRESVRLFTLEDFAAMYSHAGLKLLETYGDYDGRPYDADSPRLILTARLTHQTAPRWKPL